MKKLQESIQESMMINEFITAEIDSMETPDHYKRMKKGFMSFFAPTGEITSYQYDDIQDVRDEHGVGKGQDEIIEAMDKLKVGETKMNNKGVIITRIW